MGVTVIVVKILWIVGERYKIFIFLNPVFTYIWSYLIFSHFLQMSLSYKFFQFSWNDVGLVTVTINGHCGRVL